MLQFFPLRKLKLHRRQFPQSTGPFPHLHSLNARKQIYVFLKIAESFAIWEGGRCGRVSHTTQNVELGRAPLIKRDFCNYMRKTVLLTLSSSVYKMHK